MFRFLACVWICLVACLLGAAGQSAPVATEGDYVAQNFHFRFGRSDVEPALALHDLRHTET